MKVIQLSEKDQKKTKITGSGGIVYHLENHRTETREDNGESVTVYLADGYTQGNYKTIEEAIKEDKKQNIVTPTKNFYGDGESRADLITVLVLKLSENIDNNEVLPTLWKTKDGIKSDITFGDIKTALMESITEKGKIIGIE
jgi:hypothetical protein